MREGLRSRKVGVKDLNVPASANLVVIVEKKLGDDDVRAASDSVEENVLNLVPSEKGVELGNDGFRAGIDLEGGEMVGSPDSAGKRKRVEGGEERIGGDGIGKKKVKEEEPVNGKMQGYRRVLRSGSAAAAVKGEAEAPLGGEVGDGGDPEKEETSDHLVGSEVKRKRGRPPLMKNGDSGGKLAGPEKVNVEGRDHVEPGGGLRKKVKKDGRGRPRKVPVSIGESGSSLGKAEGVKMEVRYHMESGGGLRKKLKKDGRGRPRKVPDSIGAVKLSKGRPTKVEERNGALGLEQVPMPFVSSGQFKKKLKKRKRGRPPKVGLDRTEPFQVFADELEETSQKEEKGLNLPAKNELDLETKLDRGARPVHPELNLKKTTVSGDRLKRKRGRPKIADKPVEILQKDGDKSKPDLETKGSEASSGKSFETVDTLKNERGTIKKSTVSKNGKLEPGKREVQQAVRDKIVEILLCAGWTIQRRPRLNKIYMDSVYVSLAGHTHWSVTLAYKKLKLHYEKGDGDSRYYKPGFKFVPLPENEVEILKKIIVKRRKGNKKLNPMEVKNMMRKKKLVEKSKKGKTKGKNLLREQVKGRPSSDRDRRTLLVRKSMEEADSDEGGYIPYAGKRTVLAWMIDLGTVSLDAKVRYMEPDKSTVLVEGRITRDGIHCDCCDKTLAIPEFEIHSGSELREPFENMFIESGSSLIQCLLDSWNKQQESEKKGFHQIDVNGEDPNDDTCGICGDGGDLICCDGCPSTFHQSCLDVQSFPSGDWHCVYCLCKFCKMAGGDECRVHDSDRMAASKLLTCQLCEEKYHQFCGRENVSGDNYCINSSFCEKRCQEIFKKMKKLLGVKHDLGEGFSWTLVCRSDVGSSASDCDKSHKCDEARKIESNAKLAVALSVMDECFLPMVDSRSGINLIRNIVYNFGSNFNRLNYSGFLTAILQKGDEIISAASVRIHGQQLAEMPFIGTRYMYRRQGMCRRLLSGIESILSSLGVDRLVIPAISELTETWTSVFGFTPLEVSSKERMKNMNLMVFPRVEMLQKPVLNHNITEENLIVEEAPGSAKEPVLNLSCEATEPLGNVLNVPTVENLDGDSESIMNPSRSICYSLKQHEASLPGAEYEAAKCGGLVLCASEKLDCDMKLMDYTVTLKFSSNNGSHPSDEVSTSHESEVFIKRVDCSNTNSVARSHMSNGDCSQHHSEEKRLEAYEIQSDDASGVQTSLTLGGIYSASKSFSNNGSSESEAKCRDGQTPSTVQSIYSSFHGNGHETHGPLNSVPVDTNCDPSRGAYLERNGHCASKEVVSGSLGVIVDTIQD